MAYDNTNRGSIWVNEHKEHENHADYRGTLNVDGVEYWVSAWKRKKDANPKAPVLSFSIQPKEEARKPSRTQPQSNNQSSGFDDFEDDIPF